jgi:hypothetical protein
MGNSSSKSRGDGVIVIDPSFAGVLNRLAVNESVAPEIMFCHLVSIGETTGGEIRPLSLGRLRRYASIT